MLESKQAPCAHCGGTGKVTLPPEVATVEAYYFGCWERSGHFWRGKNPYTTEHEILQKVPPALKHIDGRFCPGAVPGDSYARRRPEVEGEAALHHVDGWTVLAWWDRSVDHRGACNSNIVARGTFDFTIMIEIGKAQYPRVITRQRSPIVLVEAP